MHRLALGILAGVLLFVMAVVGILVSRGRGVATAPTDATAATAADYRIKEVHLSEELRNGVRWRLEADLAEVYEALGRTAMRNVTVTIEQPTRVWTITGDEGELAQASRDVELRGNVVVRSSDGLRLETARLRWTAQEERAWTDVPVTIYRPGAVVRGQGLDARVGDQVTAVTGPVRATFARDMVGRTAR